MMTSAPGGNERRTGRHSNRAVTAVPGDSRFWAKSVTALMVSAAAASVASAWAGRSRVARTAAGSCGEPMAASSPSMSAGHLDQRRGDPVGRRGQGAARQVGDRVDQLQQVGDQWSGDGVHLGLEGGQGVAGAVVSGAGDLLVEARPDRLGGAAEAVGLADDRAHRVEGLGDELRRLAQVQSGGVEQVDQAEQAEQLGQRAVEERLGVELPVGEAGVRLRAVLADRAEGAGHAAYQEVRGEEPARAVRPAGEVHGGRRSGQGQQQLAGVARAEPVGVVEERLGVDQVDARRLRRQVPHGRDDRVEPGQGRTGGEPGRVHVTVEDQVVDLEGRVAGDRRDGERDLLSPTGDAVVGRIGRLDLRLDGRLLVGRVVGLVRHPDERRGVGGRDARAVGGDDGERVGRTPARRHPRVVLVGMRVEVGGDDGLDDHLRERAVVPRVGQQALLALDEAALEEGGDRVVPVLDLPLGQRHPVRAVAERVEVTRKAHPHVLVAAHERLVPVGREEVGAGG